MKYEILGISFNEIKNKANELFSEVDCGDELYYITKETYHYEDDGLTFDYKYALKCTPTDIYTDEFDKGTYVYVLYLVPTANTLHQDKLESVLDMIGCDLDDIDLNNQCSLDRIIPDICDYGLSVSMGDFQIEGEHNIEEVADKVANVIPTIDGLRGFYLDKTWNAMGSNGWTTLNCAINNGKFF